MNRRSLLTASASAAIASLLSRRKEPIPSPRERAHWLADAAHRAEELGKPLLILYHIEPASIWSDFFAYGLDQQLYPLAACEVVCASPAQTFDAFGSLDSSLDPESRGWGRRWLAQPEIALLVDTDEPRLTFHGVEAPRGVTTRIYGGIEDEAVRRRLTVVNNAVLASALRRSIAPGRSSLYRRLEQYKRAHRGQSSGDFFPTDLEPGEPLRAEFTMTHAPTILRWIEQDQESTAHLQHAMSEAVRCRTWHRSPPGAKWTYRYGEEPSGGRNVLEFATSGDPR